MRYGRGLWIFVRSSPQRIRQPRAPALQEVPALQPWYHQWRQETGCDTKFLAWRLPLPIGVCVASLICSSSWASTRPDFVSLHLCQRSCGSRSSRTQKRPLKKPMFGRSGPDQRHCLPRVCRHGQRAATHPCSAASVGNASGPLLLARAAGAPLGRLLGVSRLPLVGRSTGLSCRRPWAVRRAVRAPRGPSFRAPPAPRWSACWAHLGCHSWAARAPLVGRSGAARGALGRRLCAIRAPRGRRSDALGRCSGAARASHWRCAEGGSRAWLMSVGAGQPRPFRLSDYHTEPIIHGDMESHIRSIHPGPSSGGHSRAPSPPRQSG